MRATASVQPTFPPPMPPPAGGALPGPEAIDSVTVLDCLLTPCAMLLDVPSQHASAYARAHVDVLGWVEEAASSGTHLELTRALKWYLAMDAVLLRSGIMPCMCARGRCET